MFLWVFNERPIDRVQCVFLGNGKRNCCSLQVGFFSVDVEPLKGFDQIDLILKLTNHDVVSQKCPNDGTAEINTLISWTDVEK